MDQYRRRRKTDIPPFIPYRQTAQPSSSYQTDFPGCPDYVHCYIRWALLYIGRDGGRIFAKLACLANVLPAVFSMIIKKHHLLFFKKKLFRTFFWDAAFVLQRQFLYALRRVNDAVGGSIMDFHPG